MTIRKETASGSLLLVRVMLLLTALVWPAAILAQQSKPDTQSGKPNIVLVLMDNLGWGELGVYGGGVLRGAPTPRLDKLASEGYRLLNFNVEAQCTPSRAALMTGRYARSAREMARYLLKRRSTGLHAGR